MKNFLWFILSLIAIIGCDNQGTNQEDKILSRFPSPFDQKISTNNKLSRVLGDTLQLKNGDDVLKYYIGYDSERKKNIVRNLSTSETRNLSLEKYKDLYFLSEVKDTGYWVFAFKKEKKQVIGFVDLNRQMKSIDHLMERQILKPMTTDPESNDNHYFIDLDRKKIYELYYTHLVTHEAWEIVTR